MDFILFFISRHKHGLKVWTLGYDFGKFHAALTSKVLFCKVFPEHYCASMLEFHAAWATSNMVAKGSEINKVQGIDQTEVLFI